MPDAFPPSHLRLPLKLPSMFLCPYLTRSFPGILNVGARFEAVA